jgi:hypothetical protein
MSISASVVSPVNQPTPWSSFIPQKLIVTELINKFPVFYVAESCFIMLTRSKVRFRCMCTRAASLLESILPSILLYTWTTTVLINQIWLDLIFAKKKTSELFYYLHRIYICRHLLIYSHRDSHALMMEAIRSSETSFLTKNTRRRIPEDGFLHSQRRENLKSWYEETL